MDIIGLDQLKRIRDGVRRHYPSLASDASSSIDRLVAAGKFGVKSGHGFYSYGDDKAKL